MSMDPIIRIVTVTLLLSVSLGVILKPHPWRWKLCFVLFALGVSAFVLENAVAPILTPSRHASLGATFFAKMTVLFIWWFIQCSFSERFRFDIFRLGVGGLWLGVVILDFLRSRWGLEGFWDYSGPVLALALMLHLVWVLISGRENDLRNRRRALRIWLPAAIIALVFMDVGVDVVFGFDWRPAMMVFTQNTLIFCLTVGLVVTTINVDANRYAPLSKVVSQDVKISKLSQNGQRIYHLMTEEAIFLNPDLRLSDIVARLPISEASTRALIHSEFGCEHFRTFLNRYRINHAQTLLRDAARSDDKLIAIAFDSGFASLASFQRAFKRELGSTPSNWRKENQ